MFPADLFQLTASQGGWLITITPSSNVRTFQLTASQGGWQYQDRDSLSYLLFQLTASQGGWQVRIWGMFPADLFQLTASQGGWLSASALPVVGLQYFNSQPHKEADSVKDSFKPVVWHFNSQPHKEADSRNASLSTIFIVFQLTASQGGWHMTW